MGEASRVPSVSHKSAEPVTAGRRETSAIPRGLVRKSAKERATEPMAEASSDNAARQRGSGWVGVIAGEVPGRAGDSRPRGVRAIADQPLTKPAVVKGQISHGVKSAPTADQRSGTEPRNQPVTSSSFGEKMIEATDDRDGLGRSPRSSPRAGKPLTWRRRTVGTAGKQEVDTRCPAR